MNNTNTLRGILCTTFGGVLWGFSGTCGQYLFSNYEINSLCLTCIRLLTAGILMMLMAAFRRRHEMLEIWKNPRDAATLVVYGVFGLLMCQYAYMTAISWSNAGTTTVLQTLSLIFIMLLTCLQRRRKPSRVETIALLLALFGTYLLATGGNPTQMVLSSRGFFWGIATALAVTAYSIIPRGLMTRWSRDVIAGWGMLIGGIVLNLTARSWNFHLSLPVQGWLALAAIVLLGTVAAFTLFMQGIHDVGPVKASMLAATEPLSATVFSMLWLGTSFSFTDLIGFAAIIATIFLLAKPES